MLGKLAPLLLGVYLIAVAVNGNAGKLIDAIKDERDFLKWLIALAIVLQVREYPDTREFGNWLAVLVITAMLLNVAQKEGLEKLFSAFELLQIGA